MHGAACLSRDTALKAPKIDYPSLDDCTKSAIRGFRAYVHRSLGDEQFIIPHGVMRVVGFNANDVHLTTAQDPLFRLDPAGGQL